MSNENATNDRNPSYKLKMKVQKKYPDFTDSVDGLSLEDLRKNVIIYSTHKEECIMAKEKCVELKEAKENVAFLSGPYNDSISAYKDKLSYIHALLAEKEAE